MAALKRGKFEICRLACAVYVLMHIKNIGHGTIGSLGMIECLTRMHAYACTHARTRIECVFVFIQVLQSFQIMDYSLLVGIHNLDQALKDKVNFPSLYL